MQGFVTICKTLGEDLRLWEHIYKNLGDTGRGFVRIWETLEKICEICENLEEDS